MNALEQFIAHKSYELRRLSIIQTTQAGSGHPTSCLSAADIVAVLFFHTMHFKPDDPHYPTNDQFVLSKGHASALLYAVWEQLGLCSEQDLLTYRMFNSVLEGHPTPRFVGAKVATGSLGMGLSIGAGMALAARLNKFSYRTYVLMGDSEISEGSVWEAVQIAAHYKLDNLVAIVDCNGLGQCNEPIYDHDVERYAQLFTPFGWHTCTVNGHDIPALIKMFDEIRTTRGKPTVVVARTQKGYGIKQAEGKQGFHGKAFSKEHRDAILDELAQHAAYKTSSYTWKPSEPPRAASENTKPIRALPPSSYRMGELVATRKAFGTTLAQYDDERIVCLDAEVKNSTYTQEFEKAHPKQFIECFIAEQNMVSMGVGLHAQGKIPFISTFGAFLTRAHDQIRMAAIGRAALRIVGSHAGVSIGQDGPSQMALEDIALMQPLIDSVILYPCDGPSTHALVQEMVTYNKGISYLRTTRQETPVIYAPNEKFLIGGCKVIKKSDHDQACIIAAGITVHEALKAYELLAHGSTGITVSIIDLYCVKPLDMQTIAHTIRASGNCVVTVEDHYRYGGIGQSLFAALLPIIPDVRGAILAIDELPRSGTTQDLLHHYGIDALSIVTKVRELVHHH